MRSNIATGLTNFTGQCFNGPFTPNPVTQAQTTFNFIAGRPITFPITSYSATPVCNYAGSTFTYLGYDQSDGLPLDISDFVSVESLSGMISVSSASTPITKVITIVGLLPSMQSI
jgi:hypothetical protein